MTTVPGGYGPTTTTEEVLEGVDLTGRRVVVTGAANRDHLDGQLRELEAVIAASV